MGEKLGATAPLHLLVAGSWRLLGLGMVLTSAALLLERQLPAAAVHIQVRGTIIALAVASGLFITAGALRLAKWRLSRDAHSALAGTALLLMGGACLPLGGFAHLLAPSDGTAVVGLASRCLVSFIAMRLILHALHTTEVSRHDRPEWLLPRLFALVVAVFVTMLALRSVQVGPAWVDDLTVALLSTALAVGWLGTAVRTAGRGSDQPWARRTAPLLFGMGYAELLRGLDLGAVHSWTIAGVLVCATVAGLAARSALADLDSAVSADRRHFRALTDAAREADERAGDLQRWREHLAHDARNSCAGIRAAVTTLGRYDTAGDRSVSAGLHSAAVEEIGHLEHLLTRSGSQPREVFDASEVAHRVGRSAAALGARVTVLGDRADALGRPGDLAAVLKNLLLNAQTHAAGSTVTVTVGSGPGGVTLRCSDDGPGIAPTSQAHVFEHGFRGAASPGSGLGLHAARALMREQHGDLEVLPSGSGTTFVVTLPAAARPPSPAVDDDRSAQGAEAAPADHLVGGLIR